MFASIRFIVQQSSLCVTASFEHLQRVGRRRSCILNGKLSVYGIPLL